MNKKLVFTFFSLITLNSVTGNTESFDEFKATCADIGFKKNTEAFGDCVLELVSRLKKSELKKAEQIAANKQLENDRRKENEIAELRREQQLSDQRRRYEIAEMQRQQEANENKRAMFELIGAATGLATTIVAPPPVQSYQPSRLNCTSSPLGNSVSTNCNAY